MELNPKQIKAAQQLATGKTAREAAKEVGCTPETISVWKRDPVFEALLNELKLDALNAARDGLRANAVEAVQCLQDLVRDSKSDEVRRKAAMDVLALVGMSDPKNGLYDWGIGHTDPDEVVAQRAAKNVQKQRDKEINEMFVY